MAFILILAEMTVSKNVNIASVLSLCICARTTLKETLWDMLNPIVCKLSLNRCSEIKRRLSQKNTSCLFDENLPVPVTFGFCFFVQ